MTDTPGCSGSSAHPVGHSKSPAMYNYCFEKYGLNCAYLAFDVPMEKVADAVNALRTFNVMGANVTMPLKNAVIPYLGRSERRQPGYRKRQHHSEQGRQAHRLRHRRHGLHRRSSRRGGVEIAGKTVTLLGAGGAAQRRLL